MQASNGNGHQSIIVTEEEEELIEEFEVVEQEEEEVEEEEERPRRSTRSVSTKAAADASSQRRRSVEPVRYAQLQDEDAALAKLKYAQQTLFRKGEKRTRPNDAKTNGGGGGRTSSASSSSKRSRAEERRSARQARRRSDARSPTLSAMTEADAAEDAWRALPAMALDGSGPRSLRFQRPADAVVATVAHATAWRRVQLRHPPKNLLSLKVLTPFAKELERPLASYDQELVSACRIRRPLEEEDDEEEEPQEERTDEQLQSHVTALLADATPRVERCHATRVSHVLTATRQRVRACLATLPTARHGVTTLCRAELLRSPTISPLECVVADRQRENVVLSAEDENDDDAEDLPTYFVGKGEHSVRERGVLPKEPLRRLPALPFLSRSTTCIGVRGTLPVDDDPILRSAPVFSSGSQADTPPLASAPSILSALDDDRHELVLRFVVHATKGDARVFRVLQTLAWSTQPQTDYRALQLREAHARVAALTAKAKPQRRKKSTLATRLRGGGGNESTALLRREGGGGGGEDARLLSGFQSLFCRRCYVYNCQFHGVCQPCASARTDPVYPSVKVSLRGVLEPAEEEQSSETAAVGEQVHDDPPVDPPSDPPAVVEEKEEDVGEDVEMTADVRRSVRSVTAAATKASTLLVVQSLKAKTISKRASQTKPSSSKRKKDPHADASEYFGLDALYSQITMAKRTAMLLPQQQRKTLDTQSPDSPDTPPDSLDAHAEGCSSTCFKTLKSMDKTALWTPYELALLQLALRKVGARPCVLSHLLQTKSCVQVHLQLTATLPPPDALRQAQDELRLLRGPLVPIHDRVASVRGNTREHLQRTRVQRMKDRGSNHQFVPCTSGDSCNTNDCACMRRDHFCEQACACPRDCANRFPGCTCTSPETCGTMACLCFYAGRECDPDVCRGACRACDVPLVALDPTQRGQTNKTLRVCANTTILRGAYRRVRVAESTTHGWGAFAQEDIAAHAFIYEYTGELLSQDEAERRGNVYDRNAVSFLFDLNEDVVVDAARKGNKSKFANHASGDDANCAARIMLVRGDHRIGLYAKRAIAKGEELFFDYGHHGVVPDWSQSRIRTSGVKELRLNGLGEDTNSTAPSSPRRSVVMEEEEEVLEEAVEEAEEAEAMEVDAEVRAKESGVVDVAMEEEEAQDKDEAYSA